MKIKIRDLEYHKKELHEVTEKINQLRKNLGITKRRSNDEILCKLLKNYEYWAARTRIWKNINKIRYARKKIKTFYKLRLSKIFHQSAVVLLMNKSKRRKV